MKEALSRCTCGALLPEEVGPIHRYILSTPACWAVYCRILAREYENTARWSAHRLCVDAYAAQHPGKDLPAARQSVALHLSRLALRFERGWEAKRIDAAMPFLVALKAKIGWLEPPEFGGLTLLHVIAAEGDAEHVRAVDAWAESVWKSWRIHHETVRGWIGGLSD